MSSMLGPEVVVRAAELVAAPFDAAPFRDLTHVPLHHPQSARDRSVPRSLRVVDPGTTRSAHAVARGRPLRRRTRLLLVLSQGTRGLVANPPHPRVAVVRRRRRCVAIRDSGKCVLLADGAGGRAAPSSTRGSASFAPATSWASCGPVIAKRRGRWPRRVDSVCGTSATTRRVRPRGRAGSRRSAA